MTTTNRPTFIAPLGAVCGACGASVAGEAVWTYATPGIESAYLHADKMRCLALAFTRWREEEAKG